jgi:GTP pyrophosphokinase
MTRLVNVAALEALLLPAGPWRYSRLFLEALVVAAAMHAAQARKGSTIPYASHILGVCSIALDYGASEDEAIAALLHDAIEDVAPTEAARAAVAAFGPEVLRIVEGCTKAEPGDDADSFEAKMAYAARFAGADASILLVAAADKLHNARSIVADLRRTGNAVFGRFSLSSAETLAYYRALVSAFQANPAHRADLIAEFDRVVTEMERLASAAKGPTARERSRSH